MALPNPYFKVEFNIDLKLLSLGNTIFTSTIAQIAFLIDVEGIPLVANTRVDLHTDFTCKQIKPHSTTYWITYIMESSQFNAASLQSAIRVPRHLFHSCSSSFSLPPSLPPSCRLSSSALRRHPSVSRFSPTTSFCSRHST